MNFINLSKHKNFKVDIHDPFVDKNEIKKDLNLNIIKKPAKNKYDAVVLLKHHQYNKLNYKKLEQFSKKDFIVFDIKNIFIKNLKKIIFLPYEKNKLTFVAEIGMNADGIFKNNEKLIKAASYAGADIAKFQLGWRDDKSDINFLDHKKVKKFLIGAENIILK